MQRNILLLLIVSSFLYSCVTQSEHEKIISEKDIIAQERDKLKKELEDIKYGAPNLLADGKMFYDAKDFTQARHKFQMLLDKHPDMPQSIDAKKYLLSIDEEELWNNASTSDDISYAESYISKYPYGKYVVKARLRLDDLKVLNIKKAYDEAQSENTSYGWKKFLEDYPNYDEAEAIRKKIIRLEVDEISGDSKTGQFPSFNQYSSSYSSNSSVEITNNTGCELTVRYSGPEAEIIAIPSGGTRKVSLVSGNYKIAASACGENYAGTEDLHGAYRSTFYITTTRY